MRRYLFLCLLGFFACYKVPEYLLEEIPLGLGLENSIDVALRSGAFQEGPWPTANWWEWFDDQQLSGFIDEGLRNSPDLKRTEAKLNEALNVASQIRAKLFPHIKFF